ncbi:transglutaminaseTgpA domain-containing protein [Glutamicibacter sp. PS]|uniref:transglutaminase family protein n=1 Tax=Glutamicibacter sp. PS TaxID=3075634 RepID=UPI00283E7A90|nr:transglutaminaseTgpA domain-containing protein [Glutamicibacter sp. PS]MDR4533640.1 DUF3488 and transglutaminase-like domain-containing protein [Glutamicibacter sp. PS]
MSLPVVEHQAHRDPQPVHIGQSPSTLPWRLLAAGALATAVLASYASFNGVIAGWQFFTPVILPVVLLHVVGFSLTSRPRTRLLAVPVLIAVAIGAVLFSPAIVPWLGSGLELARINRLWQGAMIEFYTQLPPVADSPFVGFVLYLAAIAVSLIAQLLATFPRTAGWVPVPLAVPLIIASLFKLSGAGMSYLLLVFLTLILYYYLLPWVHGGVDLERPTRPGRRSGGTVAVIATASALAMLAASLWVPGFRQGMFPEGTRPSGERLASNIDPLINLGRDLRSNNGSVVFTYLSTAENAPYLRTAVIDDLSTERWEPSDDEMEVDHVYSSGLERGRSPWVNTHRHLLTMFWTTPGSAATLPMPQGADSVLGLDGAWTWSPETEILKLNEMTRESRTATVEYDELDMSAAEINRVQNRFNPSPPVLHPNYTDPGLDANGALARDLGEFLEAAFDDLGSSPTDLQKAQAIQDYLRSTRFSYSEQTPLREGYDGANQRVIEAFLERRAGYCVHFASTMVLAARSTGIPARLVLGYAPGQQVALDPVLERYFGGADAVDLSPEGSELRAYEITGRQAHAWPELFLPGIGWVPFEPTPGRGQAPGYAPAPQLAGGSSTAPEEVPRTPRATQTTTESETESQPPTAAGPGSTQSSVAGWIVGGVALLLLALLSVAPLLRLSQRRSREQAIRTGSAAAAQGLFDELRAIGCDHGRAMRPADSVGDYLKNLNEALPGNDELFERLRQRIEPSFYAHRHPGKADAEQLLADLAQLRQEFAHINNGTTRLRAWLFPPSLRSLTVRAMDQQK